MLKLQEEGWNICRQRIARIEAGEAWVSDWELKFIAKALDSQLTDLFPKIEKSKEPLYVTISSMLAGQVKSVLSPEEIFLSRSEQALAAIKHK